MSETTFSELVVNTLRGAFYEKNASTRDRSVREMKLGPHHIRHRFPFKGGVTMNDIIMAQMASHNSLLDRIKQLSPTRHTPTSN